MNLTGNTNHMAEFVKRSKEKCSAYNECYSEKRNDKCLTIDKFQNRCYLDSATKEMFKRLRGMKITQ